VVLAFAGPIVLASLGARHGLLARLTETTGDVSYGVYLFGWPIALLVAATTGSTNPLAVFGLSIPVVFFCAYAMHRLVEVPVNVTVKPWIFRWLPRFRLDGAAASLADRTARAIAYVFCVAMMARFVIYPYPLGANWFGDQVVQRVGISGVIGLILKVGDYVARRERLTSAPAS